jgi:hypothetical protein
MVGTGSSGGVGAFLGAALGAETGATLMVLVY